MPIVDAVLEEFERTYHLLHCFPDVSSLVQPIARIEEIQSLVCILLMREATLTLLESAIALSDNVSETT